MKKKLDKCTNWAGLFKGQRRRISTVDGTQIDDNISSSEHLIQPLGNGAWKVTFNLSGNVSIGFSFKYLNSEKERTLELVDANDTTTANFLASKICCNEVKSFQSTAKEAAKSPEISFISFGYYNKF